MSTNRGKIRVGACQILTTENAREAILDRDGTLKLRCGKTFLAGEKRRALLSRWRGGKVALQSL